MDQANDFQGAIDDMEEMTVQDVALGVFTAQVANGVPNTHFGQAAHRAFESAEVFMKFARRYSAGEIQFDHNVKGPQPQRCFAPNLPVTHPINLIAVSYKATNGHQGGGDLNRVAKIWEKIKDIKRLPEDESRFEDTNLGINWSRDELLTAQRIFPDYIAAENNVN